MQRSPLPLLRGAIFLRPRHCLKLIFSILKFVNFQAYLLFNKLLCWHTTTAAMCVFRLIIRLVRALTRVHRLHKQFRPTLQPDLRVQHGLDLSLLGRLPPELIIYTTRFLPPDAAASFALCCYSIYTILGTQYWESLQTRDQQQQRLAFLTLLERDLPQYILCAIHVGYSIYLAKSSWGKGCDLSSPYICHAPESSVGAAYMNISTSDLTLPTFRWQ